MVRPALTLAACLALAAPALGANKDFERMYLQIATLQGQVADLQRTVDDSLREIRRLNEVLAEQSALVKTGSLDRRTHEEALQNAVRELTERVAELDQRLQAVATAPPPPAALPTEDGATALEPGAAVPAAPPPSPRELYSQAYADYARGNFDLALQEYEEYLRFFPDTELSDNAQYWIGECRYSKKQYAEAVEAWDELLRRYPSSDKLPDARFKKAVALERLGRRREARAEYRQVVERYPNSEAGRKARERLDPQ